MPLGWIQPSAQASSTSRNKVTDSATRTASARIMWPDFGLSSPPRSMNTPAAASAARMPTNATPSRMDFMATDYPRRRRLIVLAAALLALLLTARLGVWQLARAAEKEALQALLEQRGREATLPAEALADTEAAAADQRYRRVTLRGRWIAGRTVFLDNRPMGGRTGFIVVTPLLPEGGGAALLVQRGWVPRDAAERTRLPALPLPEGVVEVAGLIAPPPTRWVQLGAEAAGPIRQNLDLERFSRETGLRLRPLSLLQLDAPGSAPDGLLRQWPKPAVDVHKHYGYAFQWFALAGLITILYVWFQLVRPRLRR